MSRRRDDLSTTDRLIYGSAVVILAVCILIVFVSAVTARAMWATGEFLNGDSMRTWDSVLILSLGLACLYFVYRVL